MIGLWFTLRTHAALIWATEAEEKKAVAIAQDPVAASTELRGHSFVEGSHGPSGSGAGAGATGGNTNTKGSIRDSQLYKRILGQSLKQIGLPETIPDETEQSTDNLDSGKSPYRVPPRAEGKSARQHSNDDLVRQVAEVAATAAAVAARDAARPKKPASQQQQQQQRQQATEHTKGSADPVKAIIENEDVGLEHAHTSGGHDAPNWGRTKSAVVLLGATLLYAIIAEILVKTVDVVLASVDIDEKFLGITLFALVPNTTEFLNAISFAMNGNIALSMEIGSAYALQVCLLQVPALVFFSAFYGRMLDSSQLALHSFKYVFSLFLSSGIQLTGKQFDLPTMGHGLGYPLRVPSVVCPRRRKKQLLQRLDSRAYLSCGHHRFLSLRVQQLGCDGNRPVRHAGAFWDHACSFGR